MSLDIVVVVSVLFTKACTPRLLKFELFKVQSVIWYRLAQVYNTPLILVKLMNVIILSSLCLIFQGIYFTTKKLDEILVSDNTYRDLKRDNL